MRTEKRTTQRGTPCAHSWTDEWIVAIEINENDLNRRICGARLSDATPCTNESNHPSGRCPLHGGFDLTGAPPGNRNAAIHGIYSRRLRTCTETCPHWQTCPITRARAFPDQSHPSHPSHSSHTSHQSHTSHSSVICPYQILEYNTVLTDALAVVESQPHQNPLGIHNAHNTAMLQVLVNAGATKLANEESPCDNPNAALAFIRLLRELRASRKELAAPAHPPLFRQKNEGVSPTPDAVLRHVERMQHDTEIDPDSIAATHLTPDTQQHHAKAYLQESIQAASIGRDVDMSEAFDNVIRLDEPLALSERDHVLASYRPAKHCVSEDLAARILGYLHLPPLPEPMETAAPEQAPEENNILQNFLDSLRQGKIPPEAFSKGSEIRAFAESTYTGPPLIPTSPVESP